MHVQWARVTVLPLWYLVNLAVQTTAFARMTSGDPSGWYLWMVGVVVACSLMYALELVGAWLFGGRTDAAARFFRGQAERIVRGYSLARRAFYLAQGVGCWLVFGVSSILAAHALGSALLAHVDVLRDAADALASWPAGVRVLVALVLLDGWSYLRHRMEHAGGETNLLWRLVHRWHHLPDRIDLWTGMVVHPVEATLVLFVPCTVFAALGFASWELFFLFTSFILIALPQHMNSGWTAGPIGAILQGPEAHVRHHSLVYRERNQNFADCFTLWDRLFGTYAPPPRGTFVGPFGLDDAEGGRKT